MAVAVTGASGHIGVNLIRSLTESGRQVRALLYPGTDVPDDLEVDRHSSDVLDPRSLRKGFDGADVVYHLAGAITLSSRHDHRVYRVNVEGTRNVVNACLETGVRRLVHFSSVHALSPYPLDEAVDEGRPLCDCHRSMPYDASKAAGEREVLYGVDRGLDAVIINPTGVIGPEDREPSFMGRVILDFGLGRRPVICAGGFNWVDVRDVCQGAMAAEKSGECGERYLLSGHYQTLSAVARMVGNLLERKLRPLCVPIWMARLGAPLVETAARLCSRDPVFTSASIHAVCHHQHVSSQKARHALRYDARPTQHTLLDTLDWFRAAGHL